MVFREVRNANIYAMADPICLLMAPLFLNHSNISLQSLCFVKAKDFILII